MTDIPATALRAREMYFDHATVRAIRAETGLSLDRLYYWLDGAPQADGGTLLPPIPRRVVVVRRSSRPARRAALVARMMRATEMQVHEIEQRLGGAAAPAGRERDARTLAVLAKTMRELIALDVLTEDKNTDNADDDDAPFDIDELRRELARRVDQIRRRRDDARIGRDDGGAKGSADPHLLGRLGS
ncbi:MAG TPA: hypothetical protein VHD14_16260 [Pseudolabrys sp.]|nr:hypothetical protein [Pseudolabrys sp.]